MAHGFAARGFVRRNYSRSRSIGYLLNGQLQDKLLSACKISQASPGTRTYAPPAELQKHAAELAKNPAAWMPWNYHETLGRAGTGVNSG